MVSCSPRARKGVSICCLVSGAFMVVCGIGLLAAFPSIVHNLVASQVPLTKDDKGVLGHTASIWATPPFQITMQFYLFNVSNGDEVMTLGAKPAVIQHGPYGYIEAQKKYSFLWSEDHKRVTYFNNKMYFFSEKFSCAECKESDIMTLLQKLPVELQYPASLFLSAIEPAFVNKPVGDLIFKGYYDFVLNTTQVPFIKNIVEKMGLDLPSKMGLFFGKNNSQDGKYFINTGFEDVTSVGHIVKWNESTLLPEQWWNTTEARRINGTDGTLFSPFVKRNDKPQIFVTDICRSVYLTYQRDIKFQGIPGYRFTIPPRVFASSVPENQGFCVDTPFTNRRYYKTQGSRDGHLCLPDGLLDVSNCQAGNPPVIISSPHFLFCPDEVVDSVQGLNPQKWDHETVVDLEPNTGVGLNFARKLQINVAINNNPNLVQFQNVKDVILPVMWLNESASLDPGTRDFLYSQVVTMVAMGYAMGFVLLGFGSFALVGVGITFLVIRVQRTRDPNRMMSNPIYSPSAINSTAPSEAPSTSATPEIMRRARKAAKEEADLAKPEAANQGNHYTEEPN